MNNVISNEKKEVSEGTNLNDKDYLDNLLCSLKDLCKNYCTVLIEASNETLYSKYLDTFLSYSNLQRKVYELVFKNGWYEQEKADENKINTKYNKLNQELLDLNG